MTMPVLFLGHGSPMNALSKNAFTQTLNRLEKSLPRPQAILSISAHWETLGTQVLYKAQPSTIHDFYGFPEGLQNMEYPAPGSLTVAREVKKLIPGSEFNETWGLDHGSWSVLVHLYPHADVPVLQLSLDTKATPQRHYEIGKLLRPLREQGILILSSGNISHNLRKLSRDGGAPVEWAATFDEGIRQALLTRDNDTVISYEKHFPKEAPLAVPSPEHYVPLLYALGASTEADQVSFPYEGFEMGSLSMRSVMFAP